MIGVDMFDGVVMVAKPPVLHRSLAKGNTILADFSFLVYFEDQSVESEAEFVGRCIIW